MKPFFTRRMMSYLVDILIIFMISSLIAGFLSVSEKAQKISENANDIVKKVTEKEIDYKTYTQNIREINYDLSRETVITTLITIVIYILYFVVYPVINKGQTIGKKLMKIKIQNNDGTKKLSMNNMIIREMILHGMLIDLIMTIFVLFLNKKNYLFVSNILNVIEIMIYITILFMVIIRKDGRGLHDILANTIVVNEEEVK